jgi:hypothetical protein
MCCTIVHIRHQQWEWKILNCLSRNPNQIQPNFLSHLNLKKVKLSPCCFFKWAPCHEDVLGEWKYSTTHSLIWALEGGEWSASRSGRFTLRERAPGTHWIGGWVGPSVILATEVKRKMPSPCQESNPRTPIVQPVAQHYTDWAITALPSKLTLM